MTLRRPPLRRCRTGALVVFAATSLISAASAADPETPDAAISWREEYGAALDEARASDHLLWIQFTGPWCPNCLRMEQGSYTHPAVLAQARSDFVPLKLRSDVNEELALSFDLSGLPASVIVDPSRQVLAVHQGYLGPEELDGFLKQAVAVRDAQRPPMSQDAATLLAAQFVGPPKPAADSVAQRPKLIKKEEHVALSGYCPVSLVSDKQLVQGQTEYTVNHEGRLYRFANRITFNLFRREPERYVPVNDGNCPVRQLDQSQAVPGDPRWGVLYQARLYLCASKADRLRFVQEPSRYAAVGVEEKGYCPHCITENGVLVQGDPRYSLSREGRRYWFPDPDHREAYLASAPAEGVRR